jgi:preprotein translocase subunit SecY
MGRLLGYDLKEFRDGFRSKQVKKRIVFTLAAVTIYKIGTHIPLPGLNLDLLRFMFVDLGSASHPLTQRAFSHMTVFSLGISPYISATIIVLLLSVLIPHLRRLRDGNREQNNKFDRLIYPITALISAGQAWGIAIFIEGLGSSSGQTIVNNPGWGFRCIVVVTLVSGTMMLVWLAHLITEKGIANGVLVIILAELFSKLIPAIIEGCGQFSMAGKTLFVLILTFGVPIILSNRALSATGTLAMWEVSRPTFPSLTIHRRLGNGQVAVKVLADSLERAEEVLASRGIMSR